MAGDWIKMRHSLLRDGRVVRMMSALHADRLRTIGGLFSAWCLFDEQTENGRLSGYSAEAFDETVGMQGIARAMESVGWLVIGDDFVEMTGFQQHNGRSAKRRAQENVRKKSGRLSACDADVLRPREEKRREEGEKKREEKRREEKPSLVSLPTDGGCDGCDEVVSVWNDRCEAAGDTRMAKVRSLTGKRRAKLRARLREPGFTHSWREAIANLPNPVRRGFDWTPSFDWLIENDSNAVKIAEGAYLATESDVAMAKSLQSISEDF